MFDEIFMFKELVEYFKLIEKIVYWLVVEGKLSGFKVGGSWCFCIGDIEVWINK